MKHFSLVLVATLCIIALSYGQNPGNTDQVWAESDVNVMPEFAGGMGGFYQFIAKNLKYPKEARRKNVEGKVWLEFVIDKDGHIITNSLVMKVELSIHFFIAPMLYQLMTSQMRYRYVPLSLLR